jgi:hypothetical protein
LGAYWARAEHSLRERHKQALLRPDFRHIGSGARKARASDGALEGPAPDTAVGRGRLTLGDGGEETAVLIKRCRDMLTERCRYITN